MLYTQDLYANSKKVFFPYRTLLCNTVFDPFEILIMLVVRARCRTFVVVTDILFVDRCPVAHDISSDCHWLKPHEVVLGLLNLKGQLCQVLFGLIIGSSYLVSSYLGCAIIYTILLSGYKVYSPKFCKLRRQRTALASSGSNLSTCRTVTMDCLSLPITVLLWSFNKSDIHCFG